MSPRCWRIQSSLCLHMCVSMYEPHVLYVRWSVTIDCLWRPSAKPQASAKDIHILTACTRVRHNFSHSSSQTTDKKSLNQWGGLYRCAHTHMHTLTVVCICESELSVLLSHTIHHKLLILLDHCGAFRTPRCSLKTQSEANAPNLSEAHTQARALTLSFQLACTHKGPEGTAMVFRVPASPTP